MSIVQNRNELASSSVNPVIGSSPTLFDRNICIAVRAVSSGQIVTKSEPCLSAAEVERVLEGSCDAFELCFVPADGVVESVRADLEAACR
jgi:hypothetical protein